MQYPSMKRPKPLTPQQKKEIVRQEYLNGATLLALAAKHKVSDRTILRWSKAGEWEKLRKGIVGAVSVQMSAVRSLADEVRVQVLAGWNSDARAILDHAADITRRSCELLQKCDLDKVTDPREMITIIKLMTDAMCKVADTLRQTGGLPSIPGPAPSRKTLMPYEEAVAVLRNLGMGPRDPQMMLATLPDLEAIPTPVNGKKNGHTPHH